MDMGRMHARRLLSHAAAATPAVAAPGPSGQTPPLSPFGSVDATVISILSLLFCVLIVALVIRALVQCACRVTRRVCYGPAEPPVDAEAGGLETAPPRDGAAGIGGKKKRAGKGAAIRAIPTIEYSAEIELAVCCSTECAICLADLKQGERVRVLPRCHHGFHVRCIDRWLSAHQSCPTCRQEPFALSARPEEPAPAPAPAAVQVHVEAAQLETI